MSNNCELKNKNLFIVPKGSHFLPLFLNNLFEKGILKKQDVVVGLIETASRRSLRDTVPEGIESMVVDQSLKEKNLEEVKTVTFLSLNLKNSRAVRTIIDNPTISEDKTFIIITDDEVERWVKAYNKSKVLEEDIALNIDGDILYCLKHLKQYIAPDVPWGNELKRILGKDIKVHNARGLFTLLSYNSQNELFDIFNRETGGNDNVSILFNTKSQGLKNCISILKSLIFFLGFRRFPNGIKFKFGLWLNVTSPIYSIIATPLLIFIKLLARLKKVEVKFELLNEVSPVRYFTLMLDYTYLFVQPRGGGSAVREFSRFGGLPFFKEESYNHTVYLERYNCPVFTYATPKKALERILANYSGNSQANKQLIERISKAIEREESCSLKVFQKLYG